MSLTILVPFVWQGMLRHKRNVKKSVPFLSLKLDSVLKLLKEFLAELARPLFLFFRRANQFRDGYRKIIATQQRTT